MESLSWKILWYTYHNMNSRKSKEYSCWTASWFRLVEFGAMFFFFFWMLVTAGMELNMMSCLFALIFPMHLVFAVVISDLQFCDLMNTTLLAEYLHPKPSSTAFLKNGAPREADIKASTTAPFWSSQGSSNAFCNPQDSAFCSLFPLSKALSFDETIPLLFIWPDGQMNSAPWSCAQGVWEKLVPRSEPGCANAVMLFQCTDAIGLGMASSLSPHERGLTFSSVPSLSPFSASWLGHERNSG